MVGEADRFPRYRNGRGAARSAISVRAPRRSQGDVWCFYRYRHGASRGGSHYDSVDTRGSVHRPQVQRLYLPLRREGCNANRCPRCGHVFSRRCPFSGVTTFSRTQGSPSRRGGHGHSNEGHGTTNYHGTHRGGISGGRHIRTPFFPHSLWASCQRPIRAFTSRPRSISSLG